MNTLAQEVTSDTGGAPLLITGLLGLTALAWKIIDFLRELVNLPGTKSAVITQLTAWVGAIAIVLLYGESQFGDTVSVGEIPVDHMDVATKILFGLALGSVAGVAVDLKKAIDNKDDASKPPLLK